MIEDTKIVPIILSGGAGTRLWPLSRPARPKQLHRLRGDMTMLQATAMRAADTNLFEAPIVVGSATLASEIEAQLEACDIYPSRVILEPEARNTAPAVALATATARSDTLFLVMPSDHVIADNDAFIAAVRAGLELAQQGWLVTFGIRPEFPETGYGYVRRGEPLSPGVFRAAQFVEKPDRATAERYLAEGCYDWNGGIFLFRADALNDALAAHVPEILKGAQQAVAHGTAAGARFYPNPGAFAQASALSIDRAVMERADRIAVVPVRMGWSDVGSWDALYAASSGDERRNVARGDVLALDTHGSLLASEGPTIVTIGVEDLIVVATGDAVLVTRRGQSQRVKEAVEQLCAPGRPDVS